MALVVADACRIAPPEMVAAATVLGRMYREDRAVMRTRLLDPHHGVRCQPVVRVHDVETPDVVLGAVEVPDERTTHVLDLVHETAAQGVRAVVIPDPVLLLHAADAVAGPREDVHLMAAALQRCRQLRHVRCSPSNGSGVQRLPGEHCDSHVDRYLLMSRLTKRSMVPRSVSDS